MRSVRQLVRIRHGSHLYGTSTPASDMDIKGVHIPSGQAIILQRAEDAIDRDIVVKVGTKNTADAVDDHSYSLQKFLRMLAKGDAVAAEILFAPGEAMLFCDPEWHMIQAMAARVINRQAKGFVDYCQRQAAKYGIKGSRMAAVKKLVDMLSTMTPTLTLMHFQYQLHEWANAEEHADWVNIPSPNGEDLWHIECCDRKMPLSSTVKNALDVYTKVWDNYGERARAAMTNDGIDWKAVSHAVRVARQALELLRFHTITFPRPDAAELLEIKQGLRPYSEVSPMLEALVAEVNACESTLPERTNMAYVDQIVALYYHPQTVETDNGAALRRISWR